jgi:propionyl-CoA carboxylase beta chain
VAHITSANDVECLEDFETIVELFTTSNKETAQSWITNSMMRFVNNGSIIPDNPNKPYDMHTLELLMRTHF